ncbi:hypothetical protein ES703_80235 [subsurface metagenome]
MPCPAAVIGTGYGDGGDIDILVVVGIDPDLVEGISGFSTDIVLNSIHLLPCPACVVCPVNFTADLSFLRLQAAPAVLFLFFLGWFAQVAVFHHCVNDIRILPVYIQADSADFLFRKALLELIPCPAAVCRLVDPASRTAGLEVPGVSLFIVGCGVQHLRVIPVDGQVDNAHFFIDVKNFLPGFPSVRGLEHSTLFIVGKKMSLCGHVHDIWICGVDFDPSDMVCVFQSHVFKRFAAVNGFIDSVTPVRAPGRGVLSCSHPEDIRI